MSVEPEKTQLQKEAIRRQKEWDILGPQLTKRNNERREARRKRAEDVARIGAENRAKLMGKQPQANVSVTIESALAALDPANDDHWTAQGLPSMSAIEKLMGDKTITRADVEAARPGFKRP